MEKAKLIIEKNKKNKLVTKLQFLKDSKIMPFPQFPHKDISYNGKEVLVLREQGKVVKVMDGDNVLYSDFTSTAIGEQKHITHATKRTTSNDRVRTDCHCVNRKHGLI